MQYDMEKYERHVDGSAISIICTLLDSGDGAVFQELRQN
jgi:hypothetical protein